MENNVIFVYGTLKRGFKLCDMLEKSKFLGDGETLHKYVMYTNGRFPMVSDKYKETRISGEVYIVSDDVLENLDIIEDCPDVFTRKSVFVTMNNYVDHVYAYMYFINDEYLESYDKVPDGIFGG